MKISYWLSLIILILLLSVGLGSSFLKKRSLDKCSNIVSAVIVDKYRIKKRGYFLKYKYTVKNRNYYSTESFPLQAKLVDINLSDTIKIITACENPDFSKILNK